MSADLTARLATLLEKEYGCKPGQVHEGYGAECASSAHAPALYRTFGCDHAAHVAAVLAEAGVEVVAEAERERDRIEALIEASSLGSPEAKAARESVPRSTGVAVTVAARHLARAERAEAALADLRTRVEALADEAASSGCIHLNEIWGRLHALLDTEADRIGGAS